MANQNVLMVGTWHLGSVIGACLAESGNKVWLWDQSESVAKSWSQGKPPIHEPGLEDLVKKHWGKNLNWSGGTFGSTSHNLNNISVQADWIVLSYDTPINDRDEVLLGSVEEGFTEAISGGFKETTNFFFTAQLPVGTSGRFRSEILKKLPSWKGHVTYQPENLRLGEAIKSFTAPDRMVLGIDSSTASDREHVAQEFRNLLGNQTTPLNVMSLESAEMVKHALNTFLATCVVYANEVAEICETMGADAWDVVSSLKQDSRVGPKAFIRPGLGFSGGTLARDVRTLSKISGKSAANNFFDDLYNINTLRNEWVISRMNAKLGGLKGKKIVLLGVTYKPNTSTVRRSPALDIARLLKLKGAECVALDPMADLDELPPAERETLPFALLKGDMSSLSAEAFKDAHGAVLVTSWNDFKTLPWKNLISSMKSSVILDTQNFIADTLSQAGAQVLIPGKP